MNEPEKLKQQYQLRFAEIGDYRNQVWQILCQVFFSRYIPADATILDLGAGWGEFINNIIARNKYAMDLNPATGEHLAQGITFVHQNCSDNWPISSGSLDVIFTSNFLEHLPDKACVERTINEAKRCLRKEGILISMGPNMKCIPGAYWDFWDHNLPFTECSISELMKMKGFKIEKCISRFLPYSMSNGSKLPLLLVKLYLRLPVFWRLFGKQFLVIGRNF
jgi:SAM-dependent methyltransferase